MTISTSTLHQEAQEIITKFHQETSYYNREYINKMNKLREEYRLRLYESLEVYGDALPFSIIDPIIEEYLKDIFNGHQYTLTHK